MDGFLVIDKPKGPSSFSVVAKVRRALNVAKAGHAGTLDPNARGVLVIALGGATRLIPFLPLEPKVYRFGIRFGASTDSLDEEGEVVERCAVIPDSESVKQQLPSFTGTLFQAPPAYSAIKVHGARAYSLARKGLPPVLPPRTITIHSLSLLSFDAQRDEALCEVSCSSGTYVRALARDIAKSLGTCGYASSIYRIRTGIFSIDKSLSGDDLSGAADRVLSVNEAFRDSPSVRLDAFQGAEVVHGRDVEIEGEFGGQPVFAFDIRGELVAVLRKGSEKLYHPEKVFSSPESFDEVHKGVVEL